MVGTEASGITKQLQPPYGNMVWYTSFFELLERLQIDKVDKSFLETHKIAKGAEYKLIGGLRFLGLIDDKGNATETMYGLRVVGEKYKENFEKMVRKAYAVLFSKIEIEKALPSDIINTFITDYSMARSTASQAAKIFVFLAQKGGIPLSKSITEKLAVSKKKIKPVSVAVKKSRKIKKSEHKIEESMPERLPEEVLGRFILKGIGYVDIKDEDTFRIARTYFKVLAKKLGITNEKEAED